MTDPTPEAEVSVIVACSRPTLIEAIARRLAEDSAVRCQLIVVGDVAGLDAGGWRVPTELVPCDDPHPNRRRVLGLQVATAPVVGFLDDDALPEAGWSRAAAELPPEAREIWTGPESPTRDSAGAHLAYAVACSRLAEGTLAHVDRRDRAVAWTDVPFCNLVTTTALLDDVGPPSATVPWDMDDFELCLRARDGGATFRTRPELAIRHDRYPDRVADWLAEKAQDRGRTGEKLMTHPELYAGIPGVVLAAVAPWALGLPLVVGARTSRGRLAVGLGALAYLGVVAGAGRRGQRGDESSAPHTLLSYVVTMGSLHVVSIVSFQVGLARGAGRRLSGAGDRLAGDAGPARWYVRRMSTPRRSTIPDHGPPGSDRRAAWLARS